MTKESRVNKPKRRIKWFSLLRISGIIIFLVVLFNVDLHLIWQYIKKVDTRFLLLAVLFQALLLFAKGIRWHILNEGKNSRLSIYQSLGEFFESYAIGVITPGRLGELMKAGYQDKKVNMFASGIRVLSERGLDVGFFVTIAGMALIWGDMFDIDDMFKWLVLVGGVAIFVVGILLISSQRVYLFLDRYIKNISLTFTTRKTKSLINIILLAFVSNAFYFVSCYLLAQGVSLKISLITTSGGVSLAGLLNMLPITVMGLGTREVTFLYVFEQWPEAQVLALSGLIFLVAQIGGGLISLFLGHLFLFFKKRV
ncbi:MAG: flippase-like domain-containing protein [Bacteroidales bacterium]|nr:flippase-like domain-containing protein [Bacteroidales bacterium]